MADLISIIVPIYNVELWIKKCLDSLICQTYKKIEIVLVDDGSIDKSHAICEQYSKSDCRIKLFTQKNQGLSAARNIGMEKANGEIITFVDGDDFLLPDTIEKAYMFMKKADICIFQYEYVDEKGNVYIKHNRNIKRQNLHMNGTEAMRAMLIDDSLGGVTAWGKLYRKNLFINNNIRFPVGKYHEDCFITYQLYYYADNVVYFPYKGYRYVQRPNSIIHADFSERYLDKIQAADECIDFANKYCVENIEAVEAATVRWYLQVANRIIRTSIDRKEELYKIREKINTIRYLSNQYLTFKYKVLIYIYQKHNLI